MGGKVSTSGETAITDIEDSRCNICTSVYPVVRSQEEKSSPDETSIRDGWDGTKPIDVSDAAE